jgi:hypothetical protein
MQMRGRMDTGGTRPEANELPPSLVCRRTGTPANTEAACGSCSACLWVAALESDFREREGEPDGDQT